MSLPFTMPDAEGRVVATAIHTGHDLRGEIGRRMVLPEATRLREEDPFTDRIAAHVVEPVVAHRSRFEVDLNRPRRSAVYREPADCWDLDVWDGPLPDDLVERSLALHDDFYRALAELLDPVAERGPFLVLDVHSYNHRRAGAGAPPEPAEGNPDVNVGTGSLDRQLWAPVVDGFVAAMSACPVQGTPLDVRENVRFKGANLAAWVHDRYPGRGCALAIEFKKTFMDEWTGELHDDHLAGLGRALAAGAAAAEASLDVAA